jgi:hypothetical protein
MAASAGVNAQKDVYDLYERVCTTAAAAAQQSNNPKFTLSANHPSFHITPHNKNRRRQCHPTPTANAIVSSGNNP